MFNWTIVTEKKVVEVDGETKELTLPVEHGFRAFESDEDEAEAVEQGLPVFSEIIHTDDPYDGLDIANIDLYKWSNPDERFYPWRVDMLKGNKIYKWKEPKNIALGNEALRQYRENGIVSVICPRCGNIPEVTKTENGKFYQAVCECKYIIAMSAVEEG